MLWSKSCEDKHDATTNIHIHKTEDSSHLYYNYIMFNYIYSHYEGQQVYTLILGSTKYTIIKLSSLLYKFGTRLKWV